MEAFEGKHGRSVNFERLETTVSVEEYVKTCVDVPTFLEYCKECDNYGTRWSCPPFAEDPLDIWSRFDSLWLLSYVLPCEPGQSVSEAIEDLHQAKEQMMAELLKLERTKPGSVIVSAGSCTLCGDHCTRPEGKPCRMPNQMRHSIEALGGDVSKTAELYLNKPILWIRDGVLPDYLMLVCGLLHRDMP